jgi:predicted transposase YbfD/YdcC
MQLPTCPHQDKAFFTLLEQYPQLDNRDNRGKTHSLPLVLMGVVMALLAGRDGNLSAIQRHMKNQFQALCLTLSLQANRVISRAQLPRLLARVNYPLLARLIHQHYGLTLPESFADWLSGDGKELRGSIAKGQQRGEVLVSIIAQSSEAVVIQTYYNGTKESERPAIVNLLTDNELLKRKVVLDALHLVPALLDAIHHQTGTYLVGLKANQHLLHRLCLIQTLLHKPVFERVDAPVRAHGRIEDRTYGCYSLAGLAKAKRWAKSGLTTVVVVRRVGRTLAGVETGQTVSYFVTNGSVTSQSEADGFYDAIRGHWGIETMHHRRDVVFSEDDLLSKFSQLQRTLSTLRTLTLSLLHSLKPQNMAAQLDDFSDHVQELIDFLRLKRVL